jgi:hypothetical protein
MLGGEREEKPALEGEIKRKKRQRGKKKIEMYLSFYVCNKTNEEVVLLFFPNKPTHIPSQFTSLFKNIDRPRSLNLKLVNQINFPRD